MSRIIALLLVGTVATGCSSYAASPAGGTTPDDGSNGDGCKGAWDCTPGGAIGVGDGSPSSVDLAEIYVLTKGSGAAAAEPQPIDLAFNPTDVGELWVVGYGDDSVHVGYIDADPPTFRRYRDPAAGHFMHRPTAISMGANGFWGTCGNNDNGQNEGASGTDGSGNLFMGPALFTTNREVFAKRITNLGSHYDMLHNSPFCRGIAHVEGNTYWAFNGHEGSLDKYAFNEPHGPGEDDHSDGEIYRYAAGQVKGAADDTVSHLFFDPTDSFLYVADTGNARIVKLDTTKGTKAGPLPRRNEVLKDHGVMEGADVEVLVAPGVLQKPAGLEVKGDLVYVTDAATSTFHVFKKDGTEVRKLKLDLPADSLAGFTFGADDKIWLTDKIGGRVLRIDPK